MKPITYPNPVLHWSITEKIYMYRNDRRSGRSFGGPREMHKAICAECKKETEVPFEPDGTRPVYCQECYRKRKPRRF